MMYKTTDKKWREKITNETKHTWNDDEPEYMYIEEQTRITFFSFSTRFASKLAIYENKLRCKWSRLSRYGPLYP